MSGAIVVLTGSVWPAGATYDANSGEAGSSLLEPASSFVISRMPDTPIPALTQLYRSLGGNDIARYGIPDESTAQLRVTGKQVVNCMAELRTLNPNEVADCFPQDSSAPLNRVMLSANGATESADPTLVVDRKVGLPHFVSGQGKASQLADTRATGDSMLGGNLPGLVIAPDSNAAKEFKLVASGASEVVLRTPANTPRIDWPYIDIADSRARAKLVHNLGPGYASSWLTALNVWRYTGWYKCYSGCSATPEISHV